MRTYAYFMLNDSVQKNVSKNIYIKTDKPSAISSIRELDLKSKEKE